MKTKLLLLRQDLKLAFGGGLFPLACVIFILSKITEPLELSRTDTMAALWDYANLFLSGDAKLLPLLAACIPYSLSYIQDLKNGVLPYVFSRVNCLSYLRSKLAACFLSSFSVGFLSYSLMLVFFYLKSGGQILGQSFQQEMMLTYLPFLSLLVRRPFLYYSILVLINSLHCGVWGLTAFFATVISKDYFVSMGAVYFGTVCGVFWNRLRCILEPSTVLASSAPWACWPLLQLWRLPEVRC